MTARPLKQIARALGWRFYLLCLLYLSLFPLDVFALGYHLSFGFWLVCSFVALPLHFAYHRVLERKLWKGKGALRRFCGKAFIGLAMTMSVAGILLTLLLLLSNAS